MKTVSYNPSQIEVEVAKAIADLHKEIESRLSANKIISIENKIHEDNPMVKMELEDKDGDSHSIVLKIIQKPDGM